MTDFGCEEGGGFNALTRDYKRTIEHYVHLRRAHPDAEIEVVVIGGFEQLTFMEAELRKHGFDPALVASGLDADPDAIDELSLQIMGRSDRSQKAS